MNYFMGLETMIKNVHQNLSDDVSKSIFENRLLYSLVEDYDFSQELIAGTLSNTYTQSNKFLQNIINVSFPTFECAKKKINSIIQKDGREVILWGITSLSTSFIQMCNNIKIVAFCDRDVTKQKATYLGCEVVSPEMLKEKYSESFVVVTVLQDKNNEDIFNSLIEMGFNKNQILVYKDFLVSEGMGRLFSQYFDSDVIKIDKNEVFVDAGCYDGNDIAQFKALCDESYEKIVAFEPNVQLYENCVNKLKNSNNLHIYPLGLWNETNELNFGEFGANSRIVENYSKGIKIKTVRLDDILNEDKVTYIKMDIEGAELRALEGAQQTILKYRPKLAICLYHKPEDIWEIPNYILSLHTDYKLVIRHYSFYHSETVLYAI